MLKSITNQKKCYTHLSLTEREEIAIALKQTRSIHAFYRLIPVEKPFVHHLGDKMEQSSVRVHKKRHKRPSGKQFRVSKIPSRVDITERLSRVDLRMQAVHREVDTVVSRQSKACEAVLLERKTGFFMVIRMKDKTASAIHEAVMRALSDFPAGLRKTLTYENGQGNALHELTNAEHGVKSYFFKYEYHQLNTQKGKHRAADFHKRLVETVGGKEEVDANRRCQEANLKVGDEDDGEVYRIDVICFAQWYDKRKHDEDGGTLCSRFKLLARAAFFYFFINS